MIPSRLADGQVVFLLPSHYVQFSQEGKGEGDQEELLKEAPGQEAPIDFSLRRGGSTSPDDDDEEMTTSDKGDEEVWRPW